MSVTGEMKPKVEPVSVGLSPLFLFATGNTGLNVVAVSIKFPPVFGSMAGAKGIELNVTSMFEGLPPFTFKSIFENVEDSGRISESGPGAVGTALTVVSIGLPLLFGSVTGAKKVELNVVVSDPNGLPPFMLVLKGVDDSDMISDSDPGALGNI